MSSDKKFTIYNTGSITFNAEEKEIEIEEENTPYISLDLLFFMLALGGYYYFSYRYLNKTKKEEKRIT